MHATSKFTHLFFSYIYIYIYIYIIIVGIRINLRLPRLIFRNLKVNSRVNPPMILRRLELIIIVKQIKDRTN